MKNMLTARIPLNDVRMYLGVPLRSKQIDIKDEIKTLKTRSLASFTIMRRSEKAVHDHLEKVITTLCEVHRPDSIDLYHQGPIRENDEYLKTDKCRVDSKVTVSIFFKKGSSRFMLVRLDPKLSDCLVQVD